MFDELLSQSNWTKNLDQINQSKAVYDPLVNTDRLSDLNATGIRRSI